MRCKVCGHDEMVPTEYRSAEISAPALECVRCQAINLDERAAKSEKDLDSVRKAVAARRAVGDLFDPRLHRAPAGFIAAAEVEAAITEVDVSLAAARFALASLTSGSSPRALVEAQHAVQHIADVLDDLGRKCAHASQPRDAAAGSVLAAPKKDS
jgi:hypothetical protein